MTRWTQNSLTVRLTGTLVAALVLLIAATAAIVLALQARDATERARMEGLVISEALYGSLHGAMLANDRDGLRNAVRVISERSGTIRVRIFNKEGKIVFSSDPEDEGKRVDTQSEACFKCHAVGQPIEKLPPGDRTRLFSAGGFPMMGVIRPIENEPGCATAACHAHPKSKRLLGVLDVSMSLEQTEANRRQTAYLMAGSAAGGLFLIVAVVVTVVRRNVHRPIRSLMRTLATLGNGDYSARYESTAIAEFQNLGESVNRMAREMEKANAELVEWAQTLERRVEEKTAELRQAQEQMIRVERMASLGKLSAVVAHEINNPLASVVTYSRLLLRRFSQKPATSPGDDSAKILEAIASESARCGEIVSNLLLFARRTGSRLEPTDINKTVDRALFLIKHKMDLSQVKAAEELDRSLEPVLCDPSQVEQALLALCINGIEAMPGGGTLAVRTAGHGDGGVRIEVEDSGVGMDAEVRRHIFEPFFTTKGEGDGKGLGLGLAVVYGIVQRHGGTIEVDSTPGQGTLFTITLPGTPPASSEGA